MAMGAAACLLSSCIPATETRQPKVTIAPQAAPEDPNAPAKSVSIVVTGLGESVLVTNQPQVTVSGWAESNKGIASVTYLNGATTGTAQGTTAWSATLNLVEGDNPLTFTAIATDGSETAITTTLSYSPVLDFTSELTFSQSLVFVGEVVELVAWIGLPAGANPTSVSIYETNVDGSLISAPIAMADHGLLSDLVAQDGIYTAAIRVAPAANLNAVGYQCFRVVVRNSQGSIYRSGNRCIWLSAHLSPVSIDQAVGLADSAAILYTAELNKGATLLGAAITVAGRLSNLEEVNLAGPGGEGGVWWVDTSGILGVYHPIFAGVKGGGAAATASEPLQASVDHGSSRLTGPHLYPASVLAERAGWAKPSARAVTALTKRVGSVDGKLISPFVANPNASFANFGSGDDFFLPWQTLSNGKHCGLVATSADVNNGSLAVSMASFRDLDPFGYIHISTHGDSYFKGLLAPWKRIWGPSDFLNGSLSQPVIHSGVRLPQTTGGDWIFGDFEEDLLTHRMAMGPNGMLVLLPEFFNHYLKPLPNSIVVLSACRSLYNNAMANAFLARGAGAVIGYTDYVSTGYAQDTSNTILSELLAGATLGEAFDASVAAHGPNDAGAFLAMAGERDLALSLGVNFVDGDFESGSLSPWSATGDGRVVTQLGAAVPTSGVYMGILSTGLGFTSVGGDIVQSFCVPTTASVMSFDWKFYSEEFARFCGKGFNDSFKAIVCSGTGDNCQVVFEETVDTLCPPNPAQSLAPLQVSDVSFDQGSVYNTPWTTTEVDMTPYAGAPVEVHFSVADFGDDVFDTVVLVDQIQVR